MIQENLPLKRSNRQRPSALRHQLKRERKTLRRAYHMALDGQGAAREWLRDNYYLLEREAAMAQKELKNTPRLDGDGTIPYIYRLCLEAVQREEELEEALHAVLKEQERWFESRELEAMGLMLRVAIFHIACQSLTEENGAELLGNMVGRLRELPGVGYEEFIARYCEMEQIFGQDPTGTYPRMDEQSRAYYRRECARQADHVGIEETKYAQSILERALQSEQARRRHIGYYLLEKSNKRARLRRRGQLFLTLRMFLPLVVSILLALLLKAPFSFLLFYLPFFEILKPLLEMAAMHGVEPAFLPRMELEEIPREASTLVTVACLLPKPDRAGELAAHLERLWRCNDQGNVRFCLLADLKESSQPVQPEDAPAIEALSREIRRLNRLHGDHFLLLVRPRVLVRTQDAYAGWERKRGAITELVRYAKGGHCRFLHTEGDLSFFNSLRYLIALDSDTNLLMDTAKELVAIALHPLNQPVVDEEKGIVTEGFGIITPRIETELDSAGKTVFSRIMTGAGGVTAYDTLSGNFYQDLFQEGIFAGKGLIDIAAFSSCLDHAFPTERVLSHDILEGGFLRAAYASDVELTDSCPSAAASWTSRLHRWIRGDFQNILWLMRSVPAEQGKKRNPLPSLHRFFLFDNLVRALAPVGAIALLLAAVFTVRLAPWYVVLAFFAPAAAGVYAGVQSLLSGGFSMLSRRYYSNVMPDALSAFARAGVTAIMQVHTALITLDAALRALYRQLISHRRLLEWTTAADAEKGGRGSLLGALYQCRLSALLGAAATLFLTDWMRVAGLILLLCPFVIWLTDRPLIVGGSSLTPAQKEELHSYAAAMWRYYEQTCTSAEHFLPPDNLQESPVHAIAHRTSPTNIGLMMLCTLCARDLGFVDTQTMAERLTKTMDSLERCEKWNGNLLNWYDTRTLKALKPRFCSAVDSGNFVCCLVALREGLLEYKGESQLVLPLTERIGKMIDQTDLKPMYDEKRKLFHIGYDLETQKLSPSYYDLLMSESRMTSYFAVATRQVPKKHWGALGRTLAREGSYAGPVSWTGTMFEYFMPHLLLPVAENSMIYEALQFCLYCQRRRAAERSAPWGCSESAFYAFDPQFNYQYKAHGIQRLGLKRQLNHEYVVSPYSTFLALPYAPKAAMKNLHRLKKMDMIGALGFYEAVDFSKKRCGTAQFAVVRSYMAHHVGMSLAAVTNVLSGNMLQKRFMRGRMAAARELLEEKLPSGSAVFEDVVERDVPEKPGRGNLQMEEYDQINPRVPRMHVLSNGDWTLAVSDTGAGVSSCQGVDITRRSADLLRRPQGVFAVVEGAGVRFCLTRAPDYQEQAAKRVEFAPGYAAFYARKGVLEGGMSASVHPHVQCEQRTIMVKNHSSKKVKSTVAFYFEPSLTKAADAAAHPAYSGLFLESGYDEDLNLVTFSRRIREGETPIHLAVGFADSRPFELERSREKALERPYGIQSIDRLTKQGFSQSDGLPDVCAALRIQMELPARSQRSATLFFTAAVTRDQAVARLISCRAKGEIAPSQSARSPLFDGGLESRLASRLLPALYYPCRDDKLRLKLARKNTAGKPLLWSTGLSGDLPIVAVELNGSGEMHTVQAYVGLHARLRRCSIKFDLAFLYNEGGDYQRPLSSVVREQIAEAGAEELLGRRGGIHLLNLTTLSEGVRDLVLSCAVFVAPKTVSAIAPALPEYTPVTIHEAAPSGKPVEQGYQVQQGVFHGERFTVTGRPILPWCHVIAKDGFGTMVSDCALGFTFAKNARENKLTPWFNDTRSDNTGEMLLARIQGKVYNLIFGARATFAPGCAIYEGQVEGLNYTVTVSVAREEDCKTIDIVFGAGQELTLELAYYTEPILGVNPDTKRMITGKWENGCLLLHNPFQQEFPGTLALCSSETDTRCCCDRAAFLCGRWDEYTLPPLSDPCAALVVKKRLPAGRTDGLRFVLGFHAEESVAADQARRAALGTVLLPEKPQNTIVVHTPDNALNYMINTWLPLQFKGARLSARTGFYQCSGAWGFRDQLQDSCAELYRNPSETREHILRCCSRQFEEGDVLHWWHELKNGPAGVRTRCSDDMVWLPYAVCEYLERTGDTGILDEEVPFLHADELQPEEKERYFTPEVSHQTATVYEHCLRALNRVGYGERGLPLIGTCDWNDGLSQVGVQGKGESVWLAQFVCLTSERMAAVCLRHDDADEARRLLDEAQRLRVAVDEKAWDGEWYLRAFFDNGTPLGSHNSKEGKIDILPQAFAVFARLPDEVRRKQALDACLSQLVDREHGVIRLFTPPLDKVPGGYISAYPGGIRENGGQYTHAAVWLARALLQEGRADEGYELLRMINPAARTVEEGAAKRYLTEPYAIAADIYDREHNRGRGGWTHYTGAAGWYYRTALTSLLGIQITGTTMTLTPCLPDSWPGYTARIEWLGTEITVEVQFSEESGMLVDGQPAREVPLDKRPHTVKLSIAK